MYDQVAPKKRFIYAFAGCVLRLMPQKILSYPNWMGINSTLGDEKWCSVSRLAHTHYSNKNRLLMLRKSTNAKWPFADRVV